MSETNKISLRYGIWCSVAYMGYMFLLYIVDKKLLINSGIQMLGIAVTIGFMIYGMKQVRNHNGGSMDFNTGLSSGFIIAVLSSFVYWIIFFLLYQIDSGMEEVTREYAQEMADWGTSFLGDKITDEERQMMEEELMKQDFGMTFGMTMLKWGSGAIGNFILALILAAILKRD